MVIHYFNKKLIGACIIRNVYVDEHLGGLFVLLTEDYSATKAMLLNDFHKRLISLHIRSM